MLKQFLAAKKTAQSKSVQKMAVFRQFKCLNINCRHRHPQKAHPWPERCLLAYFLVKIRLQVWAVASCKNLKKR